MDILIWAAVVIGGLFVLGIVFAVILKKFYRKVRQGEVLIVNTMSSELTVTFTGCTVWPIIHRAEVMDISVKRIDIDRRNKNGLICRDYLRADINVNFFIRINPEPETIIEVAQSIGCERASKVTSLEELFSAKFSEALKTAGKQFDFADLFEKRDAFRENIKEMIGSDLNGFILEDVAIDYLEQTDREFLNPSDVNDAIGIEKITAITELRRVNEAKTSKEAEAAIEVEETRKVERVMKALEDRTKIEEGAAFVKAQARIQREQKEAELELNKTRIISIKREEDEAEILVKVEEKLRKVEAAQKDREAELIRKTEENKILQVEKNKEREEREALLEVKKQTKVEEEAAVQKQAEGRKIEAVERNLTTVMVEEAKRKEETEIITARTEARTLRIKEEEGAEARKKVSEIEASAAVAELKKVETEAEGQKRRAEADAFSKERLADAEAKQFSAKEMAKAHVARENESVREVSISNDLKEGEMKAVNHIKWGEAEAKALREKGFSEVDVEERLVAATHQKNEVSANRVRMMGEAESVATKNLKFAEAEGMAKLAESQKLLDSISQDREEFRLELDKDKELALAEISVRKDVAVAQSQVLAEAFKNTDIKIIGGDGQFFDQFVRAATLGQSIDGAIDNSSTLKALTDDYISGDASLATDLKEVLGSGALAGSNLRDLSLAKLLNQLSGVATEEERTSLLGLLAKLGDAKSDK